MLGIDKKSIAFSALCMGFFMVNVFIGLISYFLVSRYIDSATNTTKKVNIDVIGQVTGFLAISLLAYALIEARVYGWSSPMIISLFGISAISFLVFLITEARTNHPMIP